ncbi:MAG: phytoene/squalene synthase family protein [Candidatus Omnitrophica bacterium]|nr:phytoene/squalene synthase family protein [Candidatus Omnitrophota bacterium]
MSGLSYAEKIQKGFAFSERITKQYATTYYFASLFLPQQMRFPAYALYTICRISDESVDSNSPQAMQGAFTRIGDAIASAYATQECEDEILCAFKDSIERYQIPQSYFDELLEGISMDLAIKRYESFDQLYRYCYRVAGVVGLIMLKIFGCQDPRAQESAVKLGIAMQLTNIVRDIKEDYARGRIYLPLDELNRYRVSEADIADARLTQDLKALLQFQIKRARQFYKDSLRAIPLVEGIRVRLVILLMAVLYARILNVIERAHYNVFSRRARVGTAEKLLLVACAFGRLIMYQIGYNPRAGNHHR